MMDWIDTITNWDYINSRGKKERIFGDRDMIDLLKCVKMCYYHPMMRGSNSIKQVLPAIINASDYLKHKYSEPLRFGTNLNNAIISALKDIKLLQKINNTILLSPGAASFDQFENFENRGNEFKKLSRLYAKKFI